MKRQSLLITFGLGLFALVFHTALTAQQPAAPAITVDADDIAGIVTGPNGPEAGVWVIAETMALPTP
ncbi:MAG: hypothetical protein AB7P99_21450, partial [Vicinamibacterales bacterium]